MRDIEDLFDEWMGATFAEQPTLASALGVAGHDGELGDFSSEAFESQIRADRQWAARLDAVDLATLSNDQQVDVALLASRLAYREVLAGWEAWRRDPEIY